MASLIACYLRLPLQIWGGYSVFWLTELINQAVKLQIVWKSSQTLDATYLLACEKPSEYPISSRDYSADHHWSKIWLNLLLERSKACLTGSFQRSQIPVILYHRSWQERKFWFCQQKKLRKVATVSKISLLETYQIPQQVNSTSVGLELLNLLLDFVAVWFWGIKWRNQYQNGINQIRINTFPVHTESLKSISVYWQLCHIK